MKKLTRLIFPCVEKLQEAQERGENALYELTKACEINNANRKKRVSNEFKAACF